MVETKINNNESTEKPNLKDKKDLLKEIEYQINLKIKVNLEKTHKIIQEDQESTKLLINNIEEENISKKVVPLENSTQDMKEYLKKVNNSLFPKGILRYLHRVLHNNLRNSRKNRLKTSLLYRKFIQAENLIKSVQSNQEIKD